MIGSHAAVVIAVFLTLFVAISYLMGYYFHRAKEQELTGNAAKLAAGLARFPNLAGNPSALAVIETFEQFTGTHVWIVAPDGSVIKTASAGGDAPWVEEAVEALSAPGDGEHGEMQSYRQIDPVTGQPFLSITLPIRPGTGGRGHEQGEPAPAEQGASPLGDLYVHAPLIGVRTTIRGVRQLLLSAGLISLVAAVAVSYITSRRISAPLQSMNRVVRAMARGDLGGRVADVDGDDEVGRLGQAFNTMAARLERHVARQAELEKMRREFVADVSHELRTPLTSIRGFLEAIADGVPRDDAEAEEYLRIAIDESKRLQRLAETLLDLSSVEAGGSVFHPVPTDLPAVAEDAADMMRPRAREKGIFLTVDAAPGLPPVMADGDRIGQVLLNLLDNALRHTPEGGEVRIEAREAESPGFVRVSVADTGPGIPEADQPYIWDRFYKVDKARSREAGSGLGLVIVKQLVAMHGGTVGLVSSRGEGSEFTFTLPAVPPVPALSDASAVDPPP